jgi:hypothetical protein
MSIIMPSPPDSNNALRYSADTVTPHPPESGAKIYCQKYVNSLPISIREMLHYFPPPEAFYYDVPPTNFGDFAKKTFDAIAGGDSSKTPVRALRSFISDVELSPRNETKTIYTEGPSGSLIPKTWTQRTPAHIYSAYFYYEEEPCCISFLTHEIFNGTVIVVHSSPLMIVRVERFLHKMLSEAIMYWAKLMKRR